MPDRATWLATASPLSLECNTAIGRSLHTAGPEKARGIGTSRVAWRSTMSGIQELFELGQTILSTVGGTLFLEMLIYVLYLHPQSPYVLKSYCTAWRRRVSNFVSSGSYEKFFFRRLLLPLLSFVSPYSYDSCAALKASLAPAAANDAAPSASNSAPDQLNPDASDMKTVIINAHESNTVDIVATVDAMSPNLWLPSIHPIHDAAQLLRSALDENSHVSFESSSAAWNEVFRNLPSTSYAPHKNTFFLHLANSYSFGAETLTHFRFFKITALMLILSGLPLLYNASIISPPFSTASNFTITNVHIANLPGSPSTRNVCYHYAPLYIFPVWCDLLAASLACYSDSALSVAKDGGCPGESRKLYDDFWSAALTLGISPADCRPPFGTYNQKLGYCKCAKGYRGTVCRSGTPPSAAYGFFFILACSVAFVGWIFMVRARESVSSEIKQRLCPQVRDFSILIQDLPPNSHLHRNELSVFLSQKFGPVKFLSFAFDDRKMFDAKYSLGACVDTLENLATSSFSYQSELIKSHYLTEEEVAQCSFNVNVDFERIKEWKYRRPADDKPGIVASMLRLLLPHPCIGFVLAPTFLYRMIYWENIPDCYADRCFPSILRVKGSSGTAPGAANEYSSALPFVFTDGVATSSSRIGLIEYLKSFVSGPSPNMVQWQALQAGMSLLECQQSDFQNTGTAIVTFEHSSSKELAVRLNCKVACQARDQPSSQQSR
jgi:hypothetical protein